MLNKIWRFIVVSSADPEKLSLTIKGLISFVPSLVIFFSLLNISISQDTLTGLFEFMGIFVSALASAITAGISIYGLIRKIIRTARGQHLGLIA